MLHTSTTGGSRRMNVTPESDPSKPAPARLNLPEAVELLVAHLKCTEEHARDLVERAVYGGSLRDVTSFDPLGAELARRGYLLVRRGDGAARYFKPGDDTKQFWSDLKGVEEANTPWIAQTQIDHLLSRYDDKLDLEG